MERRTHEDHGASPFTLLMDYRYEYAGAYLERVCEVDDPAGGCDEPDAVFYVSDVAYDDLGRRTKVVMPPGERSYQYEPTTQRLLEDRFDAVSTSGYWIQRDYGLAHAGYDAVGNVVDVRGGSSEAGDPVVAATYAYDRRNRIASWARSGSVTEHYSYDLLGNLTGYATAAGSTTNQDFGEVSGERPHAVTESSASGSAVSFTYDADGNMASALGGVGGDRHYAFD